jgi:chromosome segregation ATPase
LDNFERLEREVERLIDAYAKLKEEVSTIRRVTREKGREVTELRRRVDKLEENRQLALKKIDQLLEQLNQFDLG